MQKILELTDIELRKKSLTLKWLIFAVLVAAVSLSVTVFLITENLKISSVIPIVLVPAVNLPITLKLIRLDDERRRRIEKYQSLYALAEVKEDVHLLN
jgi:hypothetical protein